MSYRMIEHTADLCFEVTAGSFEELAAEALRAMTEWSGPWWGSEAARRDFFLEAQDRAILLVDLLNEALTLSQIHRESYERIEFLRVGEHMAEGRFIGRTVTGATDEIKAVTYHGASVEHLSDGAWSATILMDI